MDSVTTAGAPLKAPLTASLWIAEGCNLACRYCYADPTSGRLMDTARMRSLIDELADLEVFDMTVAGGEPFLHPDVLTAVDRALRRGMQLGVLTNGVLLDQGTSGRLADAVDGRGFILQVSLDSPDPRINDRTRGRGAEVVRNLGHLVRTGLVLQISCVLTSVNVDSAHRLIDAFYPGIKRFHFLNIQRTRRSLRRPDLLLSEERARDFWMRLDEHARRFPPDLFLPSLRVMLRSYGGEADPEGGEFHRKATFSCRSCSVGTTKVEIDADFDVLGCDIAKDFTRMGNVRCVPFRDVWNSVAAHRVREAPFPPCYRIRNDAGAALMDHLKPEYVDAAATQQKPSRRTPCAEATKGSRGTRRSCGNSSGTRSSRSM